MARWATCSTGVTASWHAAPQDDLQITGGAFGLGIARAAGIAIAAPGCMVIAREVDGSMVCILQALWIQPCARLDVVSVIFSNRHGAMLPDECASMGAGA